MAFVASSRTRRLLAHAGRAVRSARTPMIARMDGVEITVRLTPRASSDEISGEREGTILARVSAPAHEGRANEALRRLIASRARIGVSRVEIVKGAHARTKALRVHGMSAAALRCALGLAPECGSTGERERG